MVRTQNVSKVFYPPRGGPVEAVRDASFAVDPGEILGLLGPNGAGKTTLLRILGTIIAPTSGLCWIAGHRTDLEPNAVRRQIGFLSGSTRLYGRLTAREVLRYFGRLYGMADADIARRTAMLSERLDMADFIDRRCDSLSTGQTQKVSITRVMLHDPSVLILDEPTLGLDVMTSRTILDFIVDAKARGRAIVYSTHYMTEAELLCDRVALIHRGDLFAIGPVAELCRDTGADNLNDAFLALVNGQPR